MADADLPPLKALRAFEATVRCDSTAAGDPGVPHGAVGAALLAGYGVDRARDADGDRFVTALSATIPTAGRR